MALRRLNSDTEVRGLLQIASERAPGAWRAAVAIQDDRRAPGFDLLAWDVAVLGALPATVDILAAAARYVEPVDISNEALMMEIVQLRQRLDRAGI